MLEAGPPDDLADDAARPGRPGQLAVRRQLGVRRLPAADRAGPVGRPGLARPESTWTRPTSRRPRSSSKAPPPSRWSGCARRSGASSSGRRRGPGRAGGVPGAAAGLAGRLRPVHGAQGRPRRVRLDGLGAAARPPRAGRAGEGPPRTWPTDVRFHQWVQWVFFEQWASVRKYANERGITIVGDIPIFVALDSADVWVHREQFQMDDEQPTVVAGVPPDAFSKTGQRWGNPIYDWERMAETGFRWWLDRFKATLELVDTVRLDHFRGFAAYWSVPADEETAINGDLGARPRQGAVRRARGRARPHPDDRGRPRRDHAGRDRAARGARLPGHEGAPVRVRRRRRTASRRARTRTCPTTTSPTTWSTPAPTTTTRRSAGSPA